jgi:SNF2 family DNA or RNA helicase
MIHTDSGKTMEQAAFLEELRKIRNMEKINLKPSPYLKSEFMDDGGEVRPVVLREYQKKHVFEMLQVVKHINGSDTGLGKTLEILSTIGYVWLKEPEYVPIVLTKKSALHQWAAEVDKFMQSMEVTTVDGKPYDREKTYIKFFQSDLNKKRLLIMTYDVLLKDANGSVVRNSDHKASSADHKALVKARKTLKEVQKAAKAESEVFETWFNSRPYEIWDHAKSVVAVGPEKPPRPPVPNNWTEEDEKQTQKFEALVNAAQSWKVEADRLDAIVHPTVVTPGIIGQIKAFMASHPNAKFMLVMDEAHVVKNHRGKIHATVAELAKHCERVYGLTATPVKNRLMEFFSLFRIVVPGLFPKVTQFQNEFCITKLQRIGGGKQVPIIVGYKNLSRFVDVIEPFYLSRRKYDVAAELPRLVTRELQCELTDLQEELYDMAEAGLLEKDSDPDASSAAVLGAMTYVQEAVNSPTLLNNDDGEPWEGSSPKVDTLLELLEDELDGVKTIVFSRFERMVSLTETALKANGVKCVRITGKENKASDREKAKTVFQDPNSGVNVILITEAGSESINLQAAEHFVLLDSPWSWGTYLQLIGRMIRIGSHHTMTVATHLVAVRQDGRKTIDHYVIKKLKTKKALADKVAGEGLKDGLKFVKDDAMELVSMLKEDTKDTSKGQKGAKAAKTSLGGSSPKKTLSCVKNDPPVAVVNVDLSEI